VARLPLNAKNGASLANAANFCIVCASGKEHKQFMHMKKIYTWFLIIRH
jgi:hypothetical protein